MISPETPPGLPPLAAIRPMVEAFMRQFGEMNDRIVWIQQALIALNKKLEGAGALQGPRT